MLNDIYSISRIAERHCSKPIIIKIFQISRKTDLNEFRLRCLTSKRVNAKQEVKNSEENLR